MYNNMADHYAKHGRIQKSPPSELKYRIPVPNCIKKTNMKQVIARKLKCNKLKNLQISSCPTDRFEGSGTWEWTADKINEAVVDVINNERARIQYYHS